MERTKTVGYELSGPVFLSCERGGRREVRVVHPEEARTVAVNERARSWPFSCIISHRKSSWLLLVVVVLAMVLAPKEGEKGPTAPGIHS